MQQMEIDGRIDRGRLRVRVKHHQRSVLAWARTFIAGDCAVDDDQIKRVRQPRGNCHRSTIASDIVDHGNALQAGMGSAEKTATHGIIALGRVAFDDSTVETQLSADHKSAPMSRRSLGPIVADQYIAQLGIARTIAILNRVNIPA